MKWIHRGGPVSALVYEGLPYNGKRTYVFAYYATPGSVSGNPSLDKDLPGVILIHGRHGMAVDAWAAFWARHGYAALSMDLLGNGPNREPLPNGGPGEDYLGYDWNYHAVAKVILAHSLMLGFGEVDPRRTGVEGISLGGQVACIAAALDKRFQAAVIVYGCGYLSTSNLYSREFSLMSTADRQTWIKAFDPSSFLGSVSIPLLFVTGAADPHYPLDSWMKTCRLSKGPRTLSLRPVLDHSPPTGCEIGEGPLFMDQHLRNGPPLSAIGRVKIAGKQVQARIDSVTRPVKAYVHYTVDTCQYSSRRWQSVGAAMQGGRIVGPRPPREATAWFLTLVDERNAVVSSEVVFK
jgi:dienelactone hydrolase